MPYSPTVAITPDKNPVKPGELVPITLTLNAGRDWYQATYTLRVLNASGQLASTNEVRSPQLSGSFQGAITARPQLIFGLPAAGKTYTLEVTVTNTHGKSARATRTISVVAPPTGGGGSGENSNQVLIIKPSIRITADEDARLIVAWKNLTNVKLSVTPCIPSPALPCGGALSLPDTPAGSYSGERTFDLPSTLWRQGGATFPQVYTFTVTGTDRVGATYSEKATLIIDEAPTRLSE
ncbi:MAG: hypothetical protein KM310_00380 [Clostridiales bacterium]|nr:hypothetical protein [Clostridiales bacterium]